MAAPAVRSVKEVDPVTQELLFQLFGKPLAPNQKVVFSLLDVESPPLDAKRRKAWATINQILNKASANMKNVSEDDFDGAIEEAMGQTRPRHGA